jgi:hypothetical protein
VLLVIALYLGRQLRTIARHSSTPVRSAISDGAGSPRLVLVREPDQLGAERAYAQLAFGVRLVELAKPNRHVAAN